jgi:hypothetical protein
MSNDELLSAFAEYLDAVLNMNLEAQITEILSVPQGVAPAVALRCHRHAQQAYGLQLRPDAYPNAERTKQKTLAVVKSHAAKHPLQGMKRKDYCSLYPERSFERAALGAFFGFLQILQATK